MKALLRFLEQKYNCQPYLEDITVQDLEEYLYTLTAKGKTIASRSRVVYILRSFYNFAVRQGLAVRNVAEKLEPIKTQQKERTYLSNTEFKELVKSINHSVVRVLASTLFMTGLRINEALSLTLDDVDMERKLIHIRHGKGNKSRVVPICDKLYVILAKYLEKIRLSIDSTRFFATKKTGKISRQFVNLELQIATEKLGWKKHVTCHVLRHSFASYLVRKNVNIVKVQRLLGHSSLSTTSIYTHASMEELSEAVNTF